MGGRSSSSSTSSPVTTNQDLRRVIGEGAINAEGGSSVQLTSITTDAGAIAAGAQLGQSALDANLNALLGSLGFAQHTTDDAFAALDSFSSRLAANSANATREVSTTASNALSSVNRAASMLQEAYADAKGTTASLNTIVLASLGVAAVVAFFALRK